MDISIDLENYKLNVRSAGIIIHNNKLLTHHDLNMGHYALIGGRIAIGESSDETLIREVKEEIGKEIEITGYGSTIENFFTMNNTKYHEIMFVHKAEFINEDDKKIETELKSIEGKKHLRFEWIDLDNLEKYDLRPQAIKEMLKNKKFTSHKVQKD